MNTGRENPIILLHGRAAVKKTKKNIFFYILLNEFYGQTVPRSEVMTNNEKTIRLTEKYIDNQTNMFTDRK